jgi:flagellar basal body-associated protein FliL
MKKKLLWILIPSVLIITIVGFVFFNMGNKESIQNNIEEVESEQEILPYHETVKSYT